MKRAALLAVLAVLAVLASACTQATSPSAPSPKLAISASASPSSETTARSVRDTVMIPDPIGDSIPATPGYLDTAAYGVSWSQEASGAGRTLSFVFEVAKPIPASFKVPMDFDAAEYSFCLDTDPLSSPGGYPFTSKEPVSCDFILTAVSKGNDWTGTLIDRRPLAHKREAQTQEIAFSIDDSRTRGWFSVPAASLGDPEKFGWAMSTGLVMLPLPSDDLMYVDAYYEHMIHFGV